MTSLICLVCRCNLADKRLIKENELFKTDEREAEILIRGGIAKLADIPEPKSEPEPIEPPQPHEEVYRKAQEKTASDPELEPLENTGSVKPKRKR